MKSPIARTFLLAAGALALVGCQQPLAPSATDHYIEGQLALDQQDYAKALAELQQAIRIDPKLSVAHTAIGDIHRKEGNYDKAAEAYEAAVETNPYAFRPHYNLGVMYQLLAEAAQDAEKTVQYIAKACEIYLKAVELKADDFDANLNLSACYFQLGKLELAEKYCRAAFAADKSQPSGLFNLGIIYEAMGKPYDAIRAYKDSLELDMEQPQLLQNLGNLYLKLERPKDAQKAFELLTQQNPQNGEAWEQLGLALYYQKLYPQALAAYEQATQVQPRAAGGFRGLGVVYMTQFIDDTSKAELRDKALEAWNRSLELDSSQQDLLALVRKYTPALSKPAL